MVFSQIYLLLKNATAFPMNRVLISSGFFLCIFLTSFFVNGKSSYNNNSPQNKNSENISDQLSSLWDISESFSSDQPDSSLFYMRKLQALALANDKPKWVASAYAAIADIQYDRGYVGESVYNYLESANLFKQIGELERCANVYNSIGNVYVLAKEYDLAIKYFLQAKDIFYYSRWHKKLAMVYRNLGICYTEQKSFAQAEEMLAVGKTEAIAANDYMMLSMIYNTMGVLKFQQGEFGIARDNYNMALDYADSLQNNIQVKAFAINNIGEAYLFEEKYDQAEKWLKRALVLKMELGEASLAQSTINHLGQLYIEQERYEKAIAVLEKGLQNESLLPVDDELGKGLALIVEALVKANAKGKPSDGVYLNQKFAMYSQRLIDYNAQLQNLSEELETIGKQQVVRLAVEKHSMNTKLGVAEEKNEKFKYAIIIPVFLLICAIISVYLSLRRNARYKKLYAGIEEVLSNRALRKPDRKQ